MEGYYGVFRVSVRFAAGCQSGWIAVKVIVGCFGNAEYVKWIGAIVGCFDELIVKLAVFPSLSGFVGRWAFWKKEVLTGIWVCSRSFLLLVQFQFHSVASRTVSPLGGQAPDLLVHWSWLVGRSPWRVYHSQSWGWRTDLLCHQVQPEALPLPSPAP